MLPEQLGLDNISTCLTLYLAIGTFLAEVFVQCRRGEVLGATLEDAHDPTLRTHLLMGPCCFANQTPDATPKRTGHRGPVALYAVLVHLTEAEVVLATRVWARDCAHGTRLQLVLVYR